MIEKYEKYLEIIGESIHKFFEQQSPYIFCKEGCAMCCEEGEYPFTEIECRYAMIGYNNLDAINKKIVQTKVKKIKSEKSESKTSLAGKKFMYECPFLIQKKCSIYKYRGIICRSYGLAYYTNDKTGKLFHGMPCCCDKGLNYSNVYDVNSRTISSKKWKETGIEVEPVSHNVGLELLLNNNVTQKFGLEFGEQKALIDWF